MSHVQFLRPGPSCRGQRGPEIGWSVCLFSGKGNKYFQIVLKFDIEQGIQGISSFELPHRNMSILDVAGHDSDCRRRAWAQQGASGNVDCNILCQLS